MSSDRPQRPNVVRRERPMRPTTPISTPQLEELVKDLKVPEVPPEPVFELPDAPPEEDDVLEMTVDDDEAPAEAKPSRFAHVVRRPKP
jgi:hypothetical protein